MIVIADTTPLISLLKIDKLILLKQLFGIVWIPDAVLLELTSNSSFADEAQKIKDCEYVRLVSVEDKKTVEILRRATGLDVGESEAIVLIEEQQGQLLLMDEAKGRNVARKMGIRIMGTIGILMIALEKHLLSYEETVQAIEILRNVGRHIKEDLYMALIKEAEKYQE